MRIFKRAPEALPKVLPKGESEAAPRSLHSTGFRSNLETLAVDLRFSFRTLARSRSFTTIAVITFALGTGPSPAMFGVVHGVILPPLPYQQPDRLVFVWQTRPGVP